jgi:hypothetical protein
MKSADVEAIAPLEKATALKAATQSWRLHGS